MQYTSESLEAALHNVDEKIKEGISDGNIAEVMKDITPDIVSVKYQSN
jgi:hypothetical protein